LLRAVSTKTSEPIEGVSIEYWVRFGARIQEATISTGEDGTATMEWAPGATVNTLGLTARAPKLVPIHVLWDDQRHPIILPETKELRFESGTTIGGIVRDEAGHSIAGATVDVHGPPTETDRPNYVFSIGSVTTNPEGRWRLDVAPSDLTKLWANVTCPHYRNNGMPVSRDLNSVVVLTKGLTVRGRIIDTAGQPVRGARAAIGPNTWGPNALSAISDERGDFILENCVAGPTIITIQAEGFAPLIQDVRVAERTAPVEIRMTEPGSVLRCRVVDTKGKPVAGVRVGANGWHGYRSIQFQARTNDDGRFEWRSAPKDAVDYNIAREDYTWVSPSLAASEREHTVVLYPILVISGRVTDAETGRLVPKCRLVRGRRLKERDEIHWFENESVELVSGQYRVRIDDAGDGALIRIDAPDYKPAVSRAFQPNEGLQTFDFALKRTPGLSGIVLLPDGQPATGAEIAVATEKNRVSLNLGRFNRRRNISTVATGPDGRFTLPSRDNKFLLIAVSDAGYADALSDDFAKSPRLVLQPWGQIEGGVRIGPRSGSDQEVMFQPFRSEGKGRFVSHGYSTQTDDRGRFRFDRVIPGPGRVSRVVVTKIGGGASRHMPCWPEPVFIKPGQIVQVTIGGKGRPVTGRIVIGGTPESPVDWTLNEPVEITVGGGWFASKIDKDGRFRVEDIPAGKCVLSFPINAEPDARFGGTGTVIGKVSMPFTVPDMPTGRSNEPLDLGTITAKLFDAVKVGDVAPDFDVERIGTEEKGQHLRLGDYRGKLVLLNFWRAWDGENDMIVLKEVQQTFGADPRFVLISLVCSRDAANAVKFIKENGLTWTQGLAGDEGAGVSARYKIREFPNMYIRGRDERRRRIPLTFLIGPDGRIVAHDLIGNDLEAVRKVLGDTKLFPAAASTTQPPSSR
jgi:peroxiredoxin/protocatechuate 3,4-dioxygenase beta subunit